MEALLSQSSQQMEDTNRQRVDPPLDKDLTSTLSKSIILAGVASTQPCPALAFPDGIDDPTALFESFFLWPLGSDCNLDMLYVQQDAALPSGDALQYHSAAYEQVNATQLLKPKPPQ
jgi:hypothetical protein